MNTYFRIFYINNEFTVLLSNKKCNVLVFKERPLCLLMDFNFRQSNKLNDNSIIILIIITLINYKFKKPLNNAVFHLLLYLL